MLFKKDRYIVAQALSMWANYIQTGDPCISAVDAINMNQKEMVRPLSEEQMAFIVKLKDAAYAGNLKLSE